MDSALVRLRVWETKDGHPMSKCSSPARPFTDLHTLGYPSLVSIQPGHSHGVRCP